jgi:hypothetical protein
MGSHPFVHHSSGHLANGHIYSIHVSMYDVSGRIKLQMNPNSTVASTFISSSLLPNQVSFLIFLSFCLSTCSILAYIKGEVNDKKNDRR